MPAHLSHMLSVDEARRLAVVSQGFGSRPAKAGLQHLRRLAASVHAFQIDSVNVVVRAHYLPAFARLGSYRTDDIDVLAYEKRELFEYCGHEACLLPISLYPLLRYRMNKHSESTDRYMRSRKGKYMASVYAEVAENGPITAAELSNPGKQSGGWWGWWGSGNGKATLEHLYDAGFIAIAGRRNFERLYDITERVIPRVALDTASPAREDAMKQLICLAAKAYGVGTAGDIAGYFHIDGWRDRMPPGPRWTWSNGVGSRRAKTIVKRLVSELVEEHRLVSVRVQGWNEPAYVTPQARVPPAIEAQGFVSPFDSLVWDRKRIERLFGMKYTIEMYTPAPRRIYGYYVCPFLLGDGLVARCDLKADRARGILIIRSAFLEEGQDARRVAINAANELREMKSWLGLDRFEVSDHGNLAAILRQVLL